MLDKYLEQPALTSAMLDAAATIFEMRQFKKANRS